MKCICGTEIDGSLVIVDPSFEPSHVPCCKDCFNLWANQEFEELAKRIDASGKAEDDANKMVVGKKVRGGMNPCGRCPANDDIAPSSSVPNDANDAKKGDK